MPRSSSRPLLLGHRGSRALKAIPENTFPSFDRALADGCDGFEFDVRLTGDRHAVICHDPKVKKLEIARTDINRLGALPQLHEVLARFSGAFLDIELKVPGIEQALLEGIRNHKPRRYVVSSFLPEVLQSMYQMDQTIPLGLICETQAQLQLWTDLPIQYVIPHRRLIRQKLISAVHDSGKKALAWTINGPKEMRRLAESGIDGIISDDTELLVRTLA